MKLVGQVVRIALGVALVVVGLVFVGRLVISVAGGAPVMTGFDPEAPRGGCATPPNCVSTYATTEDHAVDPIACDADTTTAVAVFADAIDTLPHVERTSERAWVVYSRIMRFPDDVRIDVSDRGIEVFSASRLGAGDLGVNRERIEYLRELVTADERCQ